MGTDQSKAGYELCKDHAIARPDGRSNGIQGRLLGVVLSSLEQQRENVIIKCRGESREGSRPSFVALAREIRAIRVPADFLRQGLDKERLANSTEAT